MVGRRFVRLRGMQLGGGGGVNKELFSGLIVYVTRVPSI